MTHKYTCGKNSKGKEKATVIFKGSAKTNQVNRGWVEWE